MTSEDGVWRTVSGRRVFIAKGKTLTEAMMESGKFEELVNTQLKNRIIEYTDGNYSDLTAYADYLANDKPDGFFKRELLEEVSDEDKEWAIKLMEEIKKQESNQELIRVERIPRDVKVGDEIKVGVLSASKDLDFAERVISGGDKGIDYSERKGYSKYVFPKGTNSLDIEKYSPYNQNESLISGNFTVKKIESVGFDGSKMIKTTAQEYIEKNKDSLYSIKDGNTVHYYRKSDDAAINGSGNKEYIYYKYNDNYDSKQIEFWEVETFRREFPIGKVVYLEKSKRK